MQYKDFEISAVSPWIAIDHIPSNGHKNYDAMNDKFGTVGIYQVALTSDIEEIGDELVHPKIGYTGKSKAILSRTYDIRQPSGSHGAGRYIRQQGLNKETDVKIRYVYCSEDDYTGLERSIQEETQSVHGYRFAWTTASAGNDGTYSQMVELAKKLTVDEIFDIIPMLKQLAITKNQEEFMERLNEV